MSGNTATAPLPKKETLSAQVTRYLIDFIVRDRLQPGDPAPSEVQICRELNVSRGIVREAYRALATLGVLEIESGKTPRVRAPSASALTQLVGFALRTAHVSAPQVLQLRRAVEIEAARLAAQNGTDAHFRALKESVDDMRRAEADFDRIIEADIRLHTLLADATGNPLFALVIEGLRGPLADSMAQGLRSRRTRAEVLRVPDSHDAIVERVCARDADGAAGAMAHHFDTPVSTILNAGVDATRTARGGRRSR